ncbi:DUF4843 domain-containing protein [Sphingobacterium spiritivorum]|uniref:DUF4843 domain-containing protein n=1 Tax=Sphingobacterium spiritivorum ATCC 33861 TaxID=525373 RepID=D7VK42_SPHSI|nr:DUF4843 domain-containing protein [Sphingobacterium spiritivorum]EFK58644.1 hypothetical protein HMPREF0766_11361 [Sphingobacterium spiritivorum ATCC 33861]QQT34453.1 DUF4843 domain-containing protein [Sphingobacterium spiritivorum]WQD35309.1 DUF4843 domain-containing protein [Sphingobacterium spiritivorum]SUI99943.1 Uncharacterised protein [Sphingobacterium spiritivorum]
MKRHTYLVIGLLCLISIACQKDKLISFDQKPMVYIYKTSQYWVQSFYTNDSITYSFAARPDYIQTDTIFVPIRIMGDAVNYERKVNYELMNTSAADKDSYQLLPAVIKADKFDGHIPVLVKKATSLKEKESRLWIKITASEDFDPGIVNQLTYLIKINNHLSKPATWTDYYLGKYSNTKYYFIIETTGYISFNEFNESEMIYVAQTCKNKLLEYESQNNGPLMDENNEPVVFP